MSDKEKNIIRRLSDTVPKLDKDKQNYILGVAEGMAIAKDSQRDKQLQEAQEVREVHHYITKYKENGKTFVESWLQINLFGKCFCFSKKKIAV